MSVDELSGRIFRAENETWRIVNIEQNPMFDTKWVIWCVPSHITETRFFGSEMTKCFPGAVSADLEKEIDQALGIS